ncbi:UPF0223 family protein [Loigolactobacillus rennini]|uniref:Uncharacterized protein n=1 Tax=Loigolactobacillus rennini DSM 20253 TaxID=1423796 RepID=A0A0R2CYU9_9LACO|nr:UPF0223 family protein [Loigolactobacillus rennini]KRM97016.1 hypothetical protein FC24_GL001824 [Loigolactobacillus rennini DSM 20253]
MNLKNYQYPLDSDWTKPEIIQVMRFYQSVEQAYEHQCSVAAFKQAYQDFKQIVPDKAGEKRLGREFEQVSGYSIYQAVQAVNKATGKQFKLR